MTLGLPLLAEAALVMLRCPPSGAERTKIWQLLTSPFDPLANERQTVGRQSLDLAAKSDLAVGAKTNDVEDFLANVDADRGQGCRGGIHGLLLRMCG